MLVTNKETKEVSSKEVTLTKDEGNRPDTQLEGMKSLPPVMGPDGVITAGNASQTSDGAAFVLVVSERMLKQLNVKPIARLLAYHVAGVEARIMGSGPVAAVPKALEKAGLKLSDIGLFELNEAFASQSLAVVRELGIDPELVNGNGGAIAIGHPVGASGARVLNTLLFEMGRRNAKKG